MEKKIIEGKLANIKRLTLIIFGSLALVWDVIYFFIMRSTTRQVTSTRKYNPYTGKFYGTTYSRSTKSLFADTMDRAIEGLILFTVIIAILGVIFYLLARKTQLVVTDKRVYGKTSFGKRVDLPLDSISAVGMTMRKTISITTSSGAIRFSMIANRDEVHEAISNLLVERQDKKDNVTVIKSEAPVSSAAELKQYKELLDEGVITQEEFDAKKKGLLGL